MDADRIALRARRCRSRTPGDRRRHADAASRAGRRQEIARGVLGIEPHLDRMAACRDLFLAQRQRLAGGDAELPFDQIEAGDHLGHGMLDLEARVHLHEIEVRRPSAMNSTVPAPT